MKETERFRALKLKYLAIISVAAVGLACVAAFLTVSLVLISEIPFQHIFGS